MGFSLLSCAALALVLSCCVLKSLAEVPCAPVRTRSCPGENPKANLVGVFIEDCLEEPCSFKRDRNVTLEMDIEFNGDVEKLEAQVYALIAGSPIKWENMDKEACEYIVSEGDCPFEKGDYITYGARLEVLASYPPIRTDVKFLLLDEQGETQVCWIVKAQVT